MGDIFFLQKEREKTKGKNWFHLPATEMTDEIKTDLEIIKMRSVLDPKHFYKKNDVDSLPKYFQVQFLFYLEFINIYVYIYFFLF